MPMWYTKLIYLVLLIIGLFFSVLYDGIFSMLLLGVLILLPLTQFWLVHHVRRRLSVSLSLAQTEMGRGIPQKLYCTMQNKSHFPLNYCHVTLNLQQVATKETEELELQLPLQGNFAATVSFQFAAMHCGKLRISVKKCRIADYFHLFSCSVRKCTAAEGIVVPSEQAGSLSMPNLQRSEMEDSVNYDPNRPGDDNTELFGIREFRDTDNPKRIHWKRSSREETLFVKEYSRPLEKQCAIWIDQTQTKAMQITGAKVDAQMEAAHALACILMRQQVPVVLFWNTEQGTQHQTIETPEQLQRCMVQVLESPAPTESTGFQPVSEPATYAELFCITHAAELDTNAYRRTAEQILVLSTDETVLQQAAVFPISMETLLETLAAVCNPGTERSV